MDVINGTRRQHFYVNSFLCNNKWQINVLLAINIECSQHKQEKCTNMLSLRCVRNAIHSESLSLLQHLSWSLILQTKANPTCVSDPFNLVNDTKITSCLGKQTLSLHCNLQFCLNLSVWFCFLLKTFSLFWMTVFSVSVVKWNVGNKYI